MKPTGKLTGGRLEKLDVRLNPEVVAQRVGDDLVLVHLETNQIYELSSSAARLWELLATGLEPSKVRDQLLTDYDVTPKRLQEDILSTLQVLEAAHLVELRRSTVDSTSGAL